MTSELGKKHVERVQERLEAFESGELPLHRLIADLEGLVGLLLDEADPEWVGDLEEQSNRLEFVNAAAIHDGRSLTDHERAEVADAIQQLRLIIEPY